jgi:enamine deaminase RidA (YjgF/YER057c/UK114 family)
MNTSTMKRTRNAMAIIRHNPSKISSKCVEGGGLVFTTGVADNTSPDIKGQTQKILAEIESLLTAAGSSKNSILYAQIWVTDIRMRDAMNEVWCAWLDREHLPARACVEARLADPKNMVEIQVTAVKNG